MRRLLVLVCAVALFDTALYAVITPLLPTLVRDLELSTTGAGALAAAYPAGTLLASIPTGLLAARLGGRPVLLLGLGLLALASVGLALARTAPALDAARVVQGVGGAASWSGAMAWLLTAAPAGRRGELLGTAMSAAIAGALAGPVLGGTADVTGARATFSVTAGLALLLLGAALLVRDPPSPAAPQRAADVLRALRAPRVQGAMWLVAVPSLGLGATGLLVALRLGELGAGAALIAAAFLVAAALEAIVTPLAGRLADRRGRLVPMRAGLLGAAALLPAVVLPGQALLVAALLVLASVALGALWAPAMAALADAGEAEGLHMGPAFALTNLAWAGAVAAGTAGAGALAQRTAGVVPLAVLAVACLATAVALRGPAGAAQAGGSASPGRTSPHS